MTVLVKISFLFFSFSFFIFADYKTWEIVKKAVNQARGKKGMKGTFSLTVHKAEQVKEMEYEYYSKGKDKTLIRFIQPISIRNQSMLMVGNNLWVYFPLQRRVVRIPWSFCNRTWMGSDLSYDDFAKYPNVDQYQFNLVEKSKKKKFYLIKAEPLPRSPIVWGHEMLTISTDFVITKQQLYDQSQNLVKELTALSIKQIRDSFLVDKLKVFSPDNPGFFTMVKTIKLKVDVDLPDSIFSVAHFNKF